jgi:hypothetical protein
MRLFQRLFSTASSPAAFAQRMHANTLRRNRNTIGYSISFGTVEFSRRSIAHMEDVDARR